MNKIGKQQRERDKKGRNHNNKKDKKRLTRKSLKRHTGEIETVSNNEMSFSKYQWHVDQITQPSLAMVLGPEARSGPDSKTAVKRLWRPLAKVLAQRVRVLGRSVLRVLGRRLKAFVRRTLVAARCTVHGARPPHAPHRTALLVTWSLAAPVRQCRASAWDTGRAWRAERCGSQVAAPTSRPRPRPWRRCAKECAWPPNAALWQGAQKPSMTS